jgi:hypothetical protein
MGARNRVGMGVIVPVRQAGGIPSLESIPGLHKRLKIQDQLCSVLAEVSGRPESIPSSPQQKKHCVLYIFVFKTGHY